MKYIGFISGNTLGCPLVNLHPSSQCTNSARHNDVASKQILLDVHTRETVAHRVLECVNSARMYLALVREAAGGRTT
jgi:hypothetical protein